MTRRHRQRALNLLAGILLPLILGATSLPARDFASTQPAERVEYWQRRVADISRELQDTARLRAVRLVFLGDSITDFWTMAENPWFPGQQMGRAVWDETFADPAGPNTALNLGVSGDRTEHVLHRIAPRAAGGLGQLDAADLDPDVVILMIGVNNTWAAESPAVDSVFAGIRAVIQAVHERKPRARLVLQSLLPLPDDAKNLAVIQPVNARLRELAASEPFASFITFLDLYPEFVDANGKQIAAHFADGVHPNESGYRAWRSLLRPAIDRARASHAH